MPSKAIAASEGASSSMILNGVQLTPAESRIGAAILEIHAGNVDIDWNAVAEKTGHKTPKACRDAWRLAKVKTGIASVNGAAAGAPTAAAGVTTAGGTDTAGGVTPVKKRRGRPPKKAAAAAAALSTPSTSTAMSNLSFEDGVSPETPSKSTSALGIKREADSDAEDTPAKKKPASARKPRLTSARQKAAATAAAAQADTGDSKRDSVDVAMERVSDAIADMRAAAAVDAAADYAAADYAAVDYAAVADAGYATASESGGADIGEI